MRFLNGWREKRLAQGIRTKAQDVLFQGTNLVVRDRVRERLLRYRIPALHVHPSIYIDDQDEWHEDYWYLTFADRFDCWDRNASNYDKNDPPVNLGGVDYYQVYNHKFEPTLMKDTPLEQRLLFKLGGTLDADIVAHESILTAVFGSPGDNGAAYVRVSDY